MNEEYKLIPLKETQSIPVSWTFTQDEYNKLAKGHRSNWCVFLRDDAVHFCRVGGEEFYRFHLTSNDTADYTVNKLEVPTGDSFAKSAKEHGWDSKKIERYKADFRHTALDEVREILRTYFAIDVK